MFSTRSVSTLLRQASKPTLRSTRFSSTLDKETVMKCLTTPPYVLPGRSKLIAPPMVYISGEEMTRYTMEQILEQWVKPHIDVSAWEFYDLSCKSRDETNDQVLKDAVDAGKRLCAIFKEPTITPSAAQVKSMGLKKAWGSPNGAMRRGWNGITISRDTIHIDGVKLGFDRPVFFERHAVGGEYGAGWKQVGKGRVVTTFFPDDGSSPVFCDDRTLVDDNNVVVTYHNPLDNVEDLAHHFFRRCLEANIVPYVVTKKTVFKWQEGFWTSMKNVFDRHYVEQFKAAGLVPDGKLVHLISDAATMQIIRWTKGGFGMAAHNYDGDMLTDEIAQVHRSPGFITSNLLGKREDGIMIKEFEASHGTVADLWEAHLRGEETSMNPLGLIEALIGALDHSAKLAVAANPNDILTQKNTEGLLKYTTTLRKALHNTFRYGQGTRDMAGAAGLTTELFIDKVAWRLGRYLAVQYDDVSTANMFVPSHDESRCSNINEDAMMSLFNEFDSDKDGALKVDDVQALLMKLGVAPLKDPSKRGSASTDKPKQ